MRKGKLNQNPTLRRKKDAENYLRLFRERLDPWGEWVRLKRFKFVVKNVWKRGVTPEYIIHIYIANSFGFVDFAAILEIAWRNDFDGFIMPNSHKDEPGFDLLFYIH